MIVERYLAMEPGDVLIIRPNQMIAAFGCLFASFAASLGYAYLAGFWPEMHLWSRLLQGTILVIVAGAVAYKSVWMFRTDEQIEFDIDGISIPKKGLFRWSEIDRIDMPSFYSCAVTIRLSDGRRVRVSRLLLDGGLKRFFHIASSMQRRYGH